jgi:hypothetical protein
VQCAYHRQQHCLGLHQQLVVHLQQQQQQQQQRQYQ